MLAVLLELDAVRSDLNRLRFLVLFLDRTFLLRREPTDRSLRPPKGRGHRRRRDREKAFFLVLPEPVPFYRFSFWVVEKTFLSRRDGGKRGRGRRRTWDQVVSHLFTDFSGTALTMFRWIQETAKEHSHQYRSRVYRTIAFLLSWPCSRPTWRS